MDQDELRRFVRWALEEGFMVQVQMIEGEVHTILIDHPTGPLQTQLRKLAQPEEES